MSSKNRHSGKILIVDDELRNLAIVEELLEDFTVDVALTGSEAFEKAQSFRPDIVLLDIMMPGMDGYEVCRRLRRDSDLKFTKIIFISGKSMIEERLVGYEAGGDDYIPKPFDHEELLAKIRVFLRLKDVEEISHIKSSFLDALSQHAKEPLTEVLQQAEMIRENPQLVPEELRAKARDIIASGSRILLWLERAFVFGDTDSEKMIAPTRTSSESPST